MQMHAMIVTGAEATFTALKLNLFKNGFKDASVVCRGDDVHLLSMVYIFLY